MLVGMDTHVKEGQLYVQHQKFGKVSTRKNCYTAGTAVATDPVKSVLRLLLNIQIISRCQNYKSNLINT